MENPLIYLLIPLQFCSSLKQRFRERGQTENEGYLKNFLLFEKFYVTLPPETFS